VLYQNTINRVVEVDSTSQVRAIGEAATPYPPHRTLYHAGSFTFH